MECVSLYTRLLLDRNSSITFTSIHMFRQVAFPGEFFSAGCALEQLLPGMSVGVPLHATCVIGLVITLFTFELVNTSMLIHVLTELKTVSKLHTTHTTLIRFVPCVGAHV